MSDFKIYYILILLLKLTICLFTAVPSANGQDSQRTVLDEARIFEKFGNIAPQDFDRNPGHTFPHEYLLNETSIRFEERENGIVAVIDYLKRIKIYSDDSLELAQAALVSIPFYFADGIERIINIRGTTHHPDGSKTEFNPDDVRTVDLNSRYKTVEFEMPGVEAGVILEYRYTLERRYIEELPDFYFAHRVPTQRSRLFLINKNFIRYETVTDQADFNVEYTPHQVDTSSVPLVFTYERPDPVFVETWQAENIPAVDASSYISSPDDIRGKLRFQISEFGLPRQPLDNSWEFVRAQILRNANPFTLLDDYGQFFEMGNAIAEETGSPAAAQDSIFRWVNGRMQFNQEYTVFPGGNLNRVTEGEPSGRAEINLVLLGMLRGAGIEAYPLYMSGRNFGRINKEFPSLYQFNSLLVYSEISGKEYIMDASFPYSLPNLIPVELFSEQGLVLTETGYEWVTISPEKSVFDFDVNIEAELDENGDITGRLEATTRGYPSQYIRRDLNRGDSSDEVVKNIFFEIYPEVDISESRIEILDDPDRVDVQAHFAIPEYSVTFSDGMNFRPMIVGHLFDNPFESTHRRVPVTLDAPERLSIRYSITLPVGFEIEQSQQSRNTRLAGAELTEIYSASSRNVDFSFDIRIRRKEFSVDAYSRLREIYQRWVLLSNDTWFIRKTSS